MAGIYSCPATFAVLAVPAVQFSQNISLLFRKPTAEQTLFLTHFPFETLQWAHGKISIIIYNYLSRI